MPSRNRNKIYDADSYYHIYNRGVNKRVIFKDKQDYAVFVTLLRRYLDKEHFKDRWGREYESLREEIELLAFCLMPNHFHLLIYQHDPQGITHLMHRVSSAYSIYFNKKHKRTGHLFQERFKASSIVQDNYLLHISRYIHLNPPDYQNWEFSSLPYYTDKMHAGWINPKRILDLFEAGEYKDFVSDYEDHKKLQDEIKTELAGY
jgi:putative transposase